MIKEILKKSVIATFIGTGMMLVAFLVLIQYAPNLQTAPENRALMYENSFELMRATLCVIFLGSLYEQTVEKLQLFSAFKWVRRSSIFLVSVILFLLFLGSMDWIGSSKQLIIFSTIATMPFGFILYYVLEDLSSKKNAAQINRCLTELHQDMQDQ
jgi:glycopeptide antibiotics resistance protein